MKAAPVIYARTPNWDYMRHLTFCPDVECADRLFEPVSDSLQDIGESYRMVCIKTDGMILMGLSGRLDDMLRSAERESRYGQLDTRRQVCFVGLLVDAVDSIPAFPDTGLLMDGYEELMGTIWDTPEDSEDLSSPIPTQFSEYEHADTGQGGRMRLRKGLVRCKMQKEAMMVRSAILSEGPVSVCTNGSEEVVRPEHFDTVGVRIGFLESLFGRKRH